MVDLEEILKYSQNLRLLYVEDNVDAREMTLMVLEDFFDNIVVAIDGEDGYEKFKNNRIDLIITDINMPKLDGLEMIEKIRVLNSDVPILILSAYNEDNFFMKSIHLGVDGYILKPIDLDQLSIMIDKVVKKYRYLNEAKLNLHFLKEYEDVTNQSSIVSKTDTKGVITYVNDKFCEISGYTSEELIGKPHNIVRHPDMPKAAFANMWDTIKNKKQIWKGIVRNKTKSNKSYYVDSTVKPILDIDGGIVEYISLRNDITDIMNPEKQLSDALKNSTNYILIYFKLDKFDIIEEFYENSTIELIHSEVYRYLQAKLSKLYDFDTLYQLRLGEYALIIDKSKYFDDIDIFIQRLKKCQDFIKEDNIVFDTIEYDVAIVISVVYDSNKVLESARLGIKQLLKTKQDFIISNDLANIVHNRAKENMKTVKMIKNAINQSKIISYFQPIVDNKTEKIVKYESLVRLINDEGDVLSPVFFLDTAKKSDQYYKITSIVLEHSFCMLKRCNFDISINLSALDIEQKSAREEVIKLLEDNKKDAHRVVFELLEDENVKDINVVKEFISTVKEYGVKIAIDDFGAGYSNYERLLEYQPDILKIDGCLIRDIDTNNYSLSVVKSIVTFAKEQNLQTIAEFIENETIFNVIKELGVDFSQGYYFGKPDLLL